MSLVDQIGLFTVFKSALTQAIFSFDFTSDFSFWAMKKSGSVINVLSLYILIASLLGHELFHIFRNEKIRPQNTAKIVGVAMP